LGGGFLYTTMDWRDAINQSKKGTASRVLKEGDKTLTTIRYRDGSGYRLVAVNGGVVFNLCGEVPQHKMDGFTDWKPS